MSSLMEVSLSLARALLLSLIIIITHRDIKLALYICT